MATIQSRPFSKNYSGLINQSVIGLGIAVLAITGQELMKRRRRSGKSFPEGLGSRESWEFGYLYQGRSWARHPSPPSPRGWPLSWVPQIVFFPEKEMNKLRGVDATLYIRFLRGCFYFALIHTFSTFLVLFPIHVEFSDDSVSQKSMTRASITSLVITSRGKSLLWIHICLLFWVTLTWIGTLFWICNGAFRIRADQIRIKAERIASREMENEYHPHPHPQYGFIDTPDQSSHLEEPGLPLRTVMVSNLPPPLRDEKILKEYFEYFMTRHVDKPSMGLTSAVQPGFLNKSFAFIFNKAKQLPHQFEEVVAVKEVDGGPKPPAEPSASGTAETSNDGKPLIERVVVARKMTELAALLERREDVLRLLETAHLKLAKKAVVAVKEAIIRKEICKPLSRSNSRAAFVAKQRKSVVDPEVGDVTQEGTLSEEDRIDLLIKTLGPFVEGFELRTSHKTRSKQPTEKSRHAFRKLRQEGSDEYGQSDTVDENTKANIGYPPSSPLKSTTHRNNTTIWDALLSLPRTVLDPYQPLINLSHLFRGKVVPAIDYHTAKLNFLTSLITEDRSRAVSDYDPVSTAFVTFADPADARRACKYLAVHPHNPLACMVTMAPQYSDIDWIRVMKSSYNTEFLKDWIVNCGVWAFTLFWLFPISFLVGLVSIQNLSNFLPILKSYLDTHPWEQEVIQSFLPTLLVALLSLLIPLILLLIAKKAHTITTLSALHDRIMTRYYKFLIVNVLVFFCVGTATLQSVLESFRSDADSKVDIIQIVADSFPVAGPFYVGWLIFTTAMHGGFEIALFGLPLILYPATSRQVTPRKRTVGIRPRTLNFYYWLPNHTLVIHVLFMFSVMNPIVLPFGAFYYFIQHGVIKNQLIHVYAKNYEANGQTLLIRIVRYSLDGLILTQAVFLAYMVVLSKTVNVGLAGFLIVFTVSVKIMMTRMCRSQFERDDIAEAEVVCAEATPFDDPPTDGETQGDNTQQDHGLIGTARSKPSLLSFKVPQWITFETSAAKTVRQRANPLRRRPIPFNQKRDDSFSRLNSLSIKSPVTDKNEGAEDALSGGERGRGGNVPHPNSGSGESRQRLSSVGDPATKLVVPHPSPVPWDDQTTADLPYDNPYYSRAITNVLWLPRNPFGILDLDDTVNVRNSLTVEASAGQLGTWLGVTETSSPPEITIEVENLDNPLETTPSDQRPEYEFDGTEEIDLPEAIAKRVRSKEGGIGHTKPPRRPSVYSRKVSGSGSIGASPVRSPSLSTRHQSPVRSPGHGYRSFSENSTAMNRRNVNSIASAISPEVRPNHSQPSLEDPGLRPDAHAQADVVLNNQSGSNLSLPPPRLSRAQNISSHQAILNEVLAEEEQAFVSRMEEEEAEAKKATTTRSWLTSWMYKKQ